MHSGAATTIPGIVSKETWDNEFGTVHAIPSSTRMEPAKALVLFAELLGIHPPMSVLDAGTGNGRNALYLAKRGCSVTALDFSDLVLEKTLRGAKEAGLSDKISVVKHSLPARTPFRADSFDLVLDAYLSSHFLRSDIWEHFWTEMDRVTKPGGRLLSIAFSMEDEYYKQLLPDSPDGTLVCDPANEVWKRLYSEQQLKALFTRQFHLEYFAKFEFSDRVFEKAYRRVVFTSVLRKLSS
jgi:ubiquinone/menaquinone biosynthesis C-methylase UbiE